MDNLTNFNHSSDNFPEALGISPERSDQLDEEVHSVINIGVKKSEAYEILIDKASNMGELVYLISYFSLVLFKRERGFPVIVIDAPKIKEG